ncbi:MAG: DMT family transporter [Victivallales bacterium]|nr:DMT family transporter [Victivallales bacterium]
MMTRRGKGLWFGLCSTVIWGCQYSVSRFLFGTVDGAADPMCLATIRFFLGALALTPILWFNNGWGNVRKAIRDDFPQMLAMAFVVCILEGVLAFASLKFTTAARSSLLCNASPIFTVIFAALAARKWPTWGKNLGMVLGFAGLAFALTARASDLYAVNPKTLPGDLMAIGSGVAWAAYTVWGTGTAQRYGGIPCTVMMLVLGGLMMLPVCLLFGDVASLTRLPLRVWTGVVFLGIADTGWAIALWYTALAYVEPAALGAYGYLSAAIALVVARLVGREAFDWRFFVAIALVMGGIALMNYEPHQTKSSV